MKRAITAVILGASVSLAAAPARAEDQPWWKGAKDDAKQAAPAAEASSAAQREATEKAKAMREWQAKLAGSRWELEVAVSKPGAPRVVESDTLTFDNGTIGSEVLSKAGFQRAEFSLYPPEGQSISWEAMQRKTGKEGEETAIWRGEVTGDSMQGSLMKRRPGKDGAPGPMDQFTFTGKKMAAPAPAPVADAPAAPEDPLEPGAPKAP